MKIIKKLSEQIKDELSGAKEYAKCAMKYKIENPELAKTYHEMSMQEMEHMNKLHGNVVKIIEENKKKIEASGELNNPMFKMLYNSMMENWNEEHEEIMEKVTKVKYIQSMFK